MLAAKRTECKSTVCGAAYVCDGPLTRPTEEIIFPIVEHGTEILHVLSGPQSYEVFAKMGGLLYSLGDEVQHVLTKNGSVMLRNQENENDHVLFTIPEWLFRQDFIPADMAY